MEQDSPVNYYIKPSCEQLSWASKLYKKMDKTRINKRFIERPSNGYNERHWTYIYEKMWNEKLQSNAKSIQILRKCYNDPSIPWMLKSKYLSIGYQTILNKLKYYEDIAYSHHYILQLHLNACFEEHNKDTIVKHKNIHELKDIEIEIEECFCGSLKLSKPQYCLYCRHPRHYNCKMI